MSTTAPIPGIVPETPTSTSTQGSTQGQTPQAPPKVQQINDASEFPQTPLDEQPDLRLVIEENGQTGAYVYKTIDPRTGKVVSQIPREDLLKMRESNTYQPGAVIDARS